jgi:ABC-type glutathione transport system ATPase component
VQIVELIKHLPSERGMAMLFITHDLGVVVELADRVVLMRHGQVVK